MLAVQDFCHASQREDEPVSDFVSRLERSFCVAYGRDVLSTETHHMLLHSQLLHVTCYVSYVTCNVTYQALVMATKNEERRIVELRKRQQYQKAGSIQPQATSQNPGIQQRSSFSQEPPAGEGAERKQSRPIRCYNCGGIGHFVSQCRKPKSRAGPLGGNLPKTPPSRFKSRPNLQPHQPPSKTPWSSFYLILMSVLSTR